MFFVEANPPDETLKTLKMFEEKVGSVPPHFLLLATVNPQRFEIFIKEILYLLTHPRIEPDFFPFLRLYIATKENYSYCQLFNKRLLLSKKYDDATLNAVIEDISTIPLNDKHKLLAEMAVKAIYQGALFGVGDYERLKCLGWKDSDIYDAIDHAAFLFKNAKILKAYSKA